MLYNPLGGIVRGRGAIGDLYRKVFDSGRGVQVSFGDVVEYVGPDHAVFVARETGRSPGVERSLSANGLVVQAGTEPRVVAIAKCFEGGAAVAGVGRAVHRGDRPRSELSKAADP